MILNAGSKATGLCGRFVELLYSRVHKEYFSRDIFSNELYLNSSLEVCEIEW